MAAVDYFLELEGIKGETKDSKFGSKGAMDIESWSWGQSNMGTHGAGGGGGAGKVVMQDFHFVKRMDKASATLMLFCATGTHIKKGTLTARKAGKTQQEYLTFKFSDALISAYSTGGSAAGDVVPTDQFSLNFAKIEWEYKPQKPDGTLDAGMKGGYDTTTNKAV
jgi:type VI secretion system secreted protein Hcp